MLKMQQCLNAYKRLPLTALKTSVVPLRTTFSSCSLALLATHRNHAPALQCRRFGSKKFKEKLTKEELQHRRVRKVQTFDDSNSHGTSKENTVHRSRSPQSDRLIASDTNINLDYLKPFIAEMDNSIARYTEQLRNSHLGAKIEVFENIHVRTKDGTTVLREIAQVVVRSPTLVIINVYDPVNTSAAIRALHQTDSSWNPQDEGRGAIKLQLPRITLETRNALSKQMKELGEHVKIKIREARQRGRNEIKSINNWEREQSVQRDFQKVVDTKLQEVEKLVLAKQLELQ